MSQLQSYCHSYRQYKSTLRNVIYVIKKDWFLLCIIYYYTFCSFLNKLIFNLLQRIIFDKFHPYGICLKVHFLVELARNDHLLHNSVHLEYTLLHINLDNLDTNYEGHKHLIQFQLYKSVRFISIYFNLLNLPNSSAKVRSIVCLV